MNLSETRYKQFSITRFLLVGLQSLSLACAASALGANVLEAKEPPKKAVATYFPMKKGTWWKYRITRGDSVYDFTLRVVDVQKENNEDVYEIGRLVIKEDKSVIIK